MTGITATLASGGVFPTLSAAALPTTVGGVNAPTESTTVSVSGAIGSVTHSWARISGDSTMSALSPSSATTSFDTASSIPGDHSAVFRDTVTDSIGRTAHADVAASVFLFTPP